MFDPGNEPQDILADVDPAAPAHAGAPGGAPQRPQVVATSFGPRRWPLVLLGILLLGGGAGAAWFFFLRPMSVTVPEDTTMMVEDTGSMEVPKEPTPAPTPTPVPEPEPTPVPEPEPTPVPEPEPTEPVLPPEEIQAPVDTDGDGLSDADERIFGTDPLSVDTDKDGLTDSQELTQYRTDPKNPDTDGDTYLDGEEVKNGYDPNGPGKL